MRAFIVLSLIATACADVSSLTGYNYQAGGDGGIGHHGGAGGISHHGGGDSGFGGFGGAGGLGGHGGDGGFGSHGGDGGLGSHGGDGGFGHHGGDGGYEKEFYTFSANDNEFDQPQDVGRIAESLKKNLQVVFIKGPENKGLENAAFSLAKHGSDQRTAIYVLNKQADIGALADQFRNQNNHNRQKPEVHFVKYRTPEDAQNAQHQIQNQYNSLGGTTQSHDGGVAPVLDYASKGHIGGGVEHSGYTHSHPSNHYVSPVASYVPPAATPSNNYIPPAAPGNTYIPPSIFRSIRV